MALNSHVGGPLPCGRPAEEVVDNVDSGQIDEHTRACPHCSTLRRGVELLASATRALTEDPTEPPAGLVERIIQVARLEFRRGEILHLPSEHGPADISESAVAAVLRAAADSVPGIRARSCRVSAFSERPGYVRVRMSLLLRYGTGPVGHALAEVRRHVASALAARVGLVADGIDLVVVDLWPEDER